MYICICNAITDQDIKDAEAKGALTHDDVFSHFGTQPQCGCCIETMCDQLNCCGQSERRASAA